MGQNFASGQRILELACGTGEDAVWLAKRGVHVTATDGSARMVEVARAKAEQAGMAARVTARQLSLQAVIEGYFSSSFDGVFSNFGGLNTIGQWRPLASALARIVPPGGKLVLVPMGPFCPWEMIWYLAHGRPKTAFRRFGSNAPARIGETIIPIWYPSARRLRAEFAPWFLPRQTESLGLWLPPSYLGHFVEGWPDFFADLNRLEMATAHLSGGWGDHYIIVFERSANFENLEAD